MKYAGPLFARTVFGGSATSGLPLTCRSLVRRRATLLSSSCGGGAGRGGAGRGEVGEGKQQVGGGSMGHTSTCSKCVEQQKDGRGGSSVRAKQCAILR